MTIPNLPTDNLYKFATIGGLIMALFGAWFPYSATEALHREYTDKVDETNRIFRELQLTVPRDETTGEVKDERQIGLRAGFLVSEQENLNRWLEQRRDLLNRQIRTAVVCFWAGTAVMFVSLGFWYWRHQRHQDALIASERRLTEAKATKEAPIPPTERRSRRKRSK